jgi:xylulokinase
MPLLLGIDIGTTNSKVIALDGVSGRTVASAAAATPTVRLGPDHIEHDPDELWTVVAGLVRTVVAAATEPAVQNPAVQNPAVQNPAVQKPAEIVGVAISSVGEAGVFLDEHARAVYPIIAWHDTRTIEQEAWWRQQVTPAQQFAITGLPPGHIFTLLKFMWLRAHQPEAFARMSGWLSVADYIAWKLCGVRAISTSQACRTLAFDVGRLAWSEEMCAAAGVSPALFPDALPAGRFLGAVTAEAAALTGLPAHTGVVTGGHDHVCAALAAGAFRGEVVLDSTGTTEALLATVDRAYLDDDTRRRELCCGCHVAPGRFYLLAGVLGVGPLIDHMAATVAPGMPMADARDRLTQMARESPPGSRGVWVMPFLGGAGAPERDPEATCSILGLREHHTMSDVARATFEGLGYEMRTLLEAMVAGAGIPTPTVRAMGGGAANDFWLQLKADITGTVVERPVAREGGALGAALLAGIGVGLFPDAEAAYACVAAPPTCFVPDGERHAQYDVSFRSTYLSASRSVRRLTGK